MEDCMLTTYDNPFNPFEDFVVWFKYDLILGHNTCGLLAREVNSSPVYSSERDEQLTQEAIDYIVSIAPTLYRKVTRKDFES